MESVGNETIELVIHENRPSWDKASRDYKDAQGKEVTWGRTADTVGISGKIEEHKFQMRWGSNFLN